MTRTNDARLSIVLVCMLALIGGCEREKRSFEPPAASGARVGATADARIDGAGYVENAYALANGKRLYDWYNCSGCHAHGGGGSGPALMDDVWIYGSEPRAVYQTIFEGRPNGMPSFGHRVPEDQLWQIVAYVRSISGLASKHAATSRDDALQAKPSENRVDPQQPVTANASSASQRP